MCHFFVVISIILESFRLRILFNKFLIYWRYISFFGNVELIKSPSKEYMLNLTL